MSAPAAVLLWELSLSTPAVTLGETVVLSGTLRPGPGGDLALAPPPPDAPFAVVRARVEKGRGAGPDRTQAVEAELLPLEPGKVALSLAFRAPGGGEAGAVSSPPLTVAVAEPAPAPEGSVPRDIKPPRPARPPLWPWAAAALAAALAWALARRKRARAPLAAAAAQESRPPEAVALEALDRLEASGLWERGAHREFYAELAGILRLYLERRFGLPATRLTTAETLRHLRELEVPRATAQAVREALGRADLVKFAKAVPGPDWGGLDLETARRVVRESAPRVPAAEAAR